jgi:hypothetical protein
MNLTQEIMLVSWIKQVTSCEDRTLTPFLQGWLPKSARSAAAEFVEMLRLREPVGKLESDIRNLSHNGVSVKGRSYHSEELDQLYRMHGKVKCEVKFLPACSAVILIVPPGDGPLVAAFDVLEERRLQFDPAAPSNAMLDKLSVHLRNSIDLHSSPRTGADSRFQNGALSGTHNLIGLHEQGGERDARS